MLRRSKPIIVATVIVCFVLALGYALFATPKYTASARILIDPAALQIVGTGLSSPAGTRDTSGIETESQIYVLTSGNVFDGVIAQEKLDTNPLFGMRKQGLLSQILTALGLVAPIDAKAMARRQLDRAVTVSRSNGSFVLTVNVQTESRDLSVRIADAILDIYLKEQRRNQADTARRAAEQLDTRLGDLRGRVRSAEERYEEYRRASGIVTSAGQPLLEKQVADITGAIGAAQSRVSELRTSLEQIRRVKDGNIDALPEAFRGGSLETLKNRYAAARQLETNTAATLGPRHPDRVTAASQTAEARRLLDQAIHDVIESSTAELERARAVEASLKSRLENTKTDLGSSNDASVKLRELARDVDANRAIYESFLSRSRELSERERLDTSNTRILGRATRPLEANGPPAILILLGSIFLGLGLGVALAWLHEQILPSLRTNRP